MMLRASEKAFAVSAISHALLLLCVFQLSQWRPVQRGYPRTITAVLMPKGGGQPKTSFSTPPAGATVASLQTPAPETKKVEPKKNEPLPAVVKERVEKKTSPALANKKAPATSTDKNSSKKKSETTAPASGSSSAPQTDGGKSGPGSGVGGVARVDGPTFPFPHYLALLQFRIENQWQPPYLGTGQFLATVHFVIAKSGGIVSAKIEQSSGNFAFDQASLRAVHSANPLPALPEGASMETLGVHFDFVANW